MLSRVKRAIKRIIKNSNVPNIGNFETTIFRNDDVSFDSDVNCFKAFCEIFHRAGFYQLHGINVYGRTNCSYIINGVPAMYNNIDPKDTHNYQILRTVAVDYIGNNQELIDYLNEIPDEIALHGLYHSDYSLMSKEEQDEDISKGLSALKTLFPNKKVSVFIPPFNKYNKDTEVVCKKYGLTICGEVGDHLEDMISNSRGPLIKNQLYRYHHHRFYPESTFFYYDLSLDILSEYLKNNSYTYNKKTGRYMPSIELLSRIVNDCGAQAWYSYSYSCFKERKHVYHAYSWIKKNVSPEKKVLEVACGAGGMLYHLYADGFSNLSGYDYDDKAVEAARKICTCMSNNIRIFQDDATNPKFDGEYDVILWTNGMYHLDNFTLGDFYNYHVRHLSDGGYFIFDMVDESFNNVPQNQYSSKDWNKDIPDESKKPSEYRLRMSERDVIKVGERFNLKLVKIFDVCDTIPRKVYIFRRKKPKVCFLCDQRGWAYDHRAQNLVNNLKDEFNFEIKYVVDKPDLKSSNYDILVVFFWGETIYKKYRVPKKKIIKEVTSHRWQYDECYNKLSPAEFAAKYLNDANSIATQSQILYDLLNKHCSNLFLCPQGFPSEIFKLEKKREGVMKICMAGNINDPVKGVNNILIPAAKKYKLSIASDLKYEELCSFYNESDVYALTSLHEGTPQPLLESMACGCFPVCTRVGNAPELIRHKDNGYLVENRTPEAFEEAFEWCNNHLEYVRQKGIMNAYEIYEKRRWGKMQENYRSLFRDHLGRMKLKG